MQASRLRPAWRRVAFVALFATGSVLPYESITAQLEAPRARIVQEYRIDATAEDLTFISVLSAGRNGELMLLQPRDSRILLFDKAGKRIATIGRKGQGPGEFSQDFIGGFVGDSVWAYDRVQNRFSVFTSDGHLIRTANSASTLPTQRSSPGLSNSVGVTQLLSFQPQALFADGDILGLGRFGMQQNVRRPDGSMVKMQSGSYLEFIRVSSKGETIRAIGRVPDIDTTSVATVQLGPMSSISSPVPFVSGTVSVVSQNGSRVGFLSTTISGRTGSFRIVLLGTQGDTVLSRSYPFAPVPITSATSDSAVQAVMKNYWDIPADRGRPPRDKILELERKVRSQMPGSRSPVRGLRLGADDTIWLTLPSTEEGRRYVRLDQSGELAIEVMLPRRMSLLQASANRIWASHVDDDGLESVVCFRIDGAK